MPPNPFLSPPLFNAAPGSIRLFTAYSRERSPIPEQEAIP